MIEIRHIEEKDQQQLAAIYERHGFRHIPQRLGDSGHTATTIFMVKELYDNVYECCLCKSQLQNRISREKSSSLCSLVSLFFCFV